MVSGYLHGILIAEEETHLQVVSADSSTRLRVSFTAGYVLEAESLQDMNKGTLASFYE